jgi:hypothetical protein
MATNSGELRQTIQRYLVLLEDSGGTPEENLLRLADVLDELARLARYTEPFFEDGYPDPPSAGRDRYKQNRGLAATRFPGLGPYNLPDPISRSPGECQIAVADPYDDIADIAGDLLQVQWCFAHTSDQDALWHFRLGHDSHWGDHLSNLRWYLYARAFDR